MARRLPAVRLWNLYGQTEIAPLATLLGPEDQLRKPGSCGRPALNVETRVVDLDMNDVKPGEIGEIVHRSPHLMTGYFHDEERTAAAFEGGWFHSGDLAMIDEEGYITVVDRKKDMIKTGGENVASREVEEALYHLPAVSEVAVIGVPHPRWVEAVVAVVVLKAGQAASEEDILAHARAKLARFKTPKRVVFAASLPKNPSGKLLKRQLRDAYGELFGVSPPIRRFVRKILSRVRPRPTQRWNVRIFPADSEVAASPTGAFGQCRPLTAPRTARSTDSARRTTGSRSDDLLAGVLRPAADVDRRGDRRARGDADGDALEPARPDAPCRRRSDCRR